MKHSFRPAAAARGCGAAVSLVALLLVTLTACSSGGDSNSAAGAAEQDPTDVCTVDRVDPDSTLTVSTKVATTSLDPVTALGALYGAEETSVLYDTLTRYDSETGLYVPYLAEDVTANGDSTEWTVKLRPGVTFGNGDPMTSADVVYSMDRMRSDKATTPTKSFLAPISAVRAVDDLTVVYTLSRPWAGFPWVLSDLGGMVVNRNVVDATGAGFATNPAGAGVGPYEFVRFAPSEEVVMKAKPDYWGGPICIGTLRFVSVPGSQATLEAFEKGDIDVATVSVDPTVSKELSELPDTVTLHYLRSGAGVGMNERQGRILGDPALREAVVAALDPDAVNQRVFGGNGTMARTLTVPEMNIWGGVDGPEYDLDKAKDLVAQAKANGMTEPVNFVVADTADPELVLVIEALLKNAGFDVKTETLALGAYLPRLNSGDFDIVINNTAIGEDAPLRMVWAYDSRSPINRWGLASPTVDAALDSLYLAKGPQETAASVATLQEYWNEFAPTSPLWVEDWTKAFSTDVRGLRQGPEGRLSYEGAYIAR